PAILRAQVDEAETTIHAATGVYPRLFRPPQGIRSPWLMRALEQDSLTTVTWDDAPRDWEKRSADDLVKRTLRDARPGAIILLHDGQTLHPPAARSPAARAPPRLTAALRARGSRSVPVPERLQEPATLPAWTPPAAGKGTMGPAS